MSENATKYIRNALRCVEQMLDGLKYGSIQVRHLELLMVNQQQFQALALVVNQGVSILPLLEMRHHELKTYHRTGALLDVLLDHCKQYLSTGI